MKKHKRSSVFMVLTNFGKYGHSFNQFDLVVSTDRIKFYEGSCSKYCACGGTLEQTVPNDELLYIGRL